MRNVNLVVIVLIKLLCFVEMYSNFSPLAYQLCAKLVSYSRFVILCRMRATYEDSTLKRDFVCSTQRHSPLHCFYHDYIQSHSYCGLLQIVSCLCELAEANARELKSGWKALFRSLRSVKVTAFLLLHIPN